ncbi:MAG: acyl-CoA reductase [Candidatus Helarchaeota archaeon]
MAIHLIYFQNRFYSFNEKKISDLNTIKGEINKHKLILKENNLEKIVELFHQYGRNLIRDNIVKSIEGVTFLSSWLQKSNVFKMVKNNLGDFKVLNKFVGEGRKKIKAQPRGLICHWIAGNVPTLGMFSLIQSILVGNSNIVRIPIESQEIFVQLLKVLERSEYGGLKGSNILKTVAVIYFPSTDTESNLKFSLVADARVIWGGQEAVDAISKTTKMSHCEDIVFGPKYSFGVVDKVAQRSEDFPKIIRRFINDIIVFDQSACSSPQVIFFEKGGIDFNLIIKKFEEEFKLASKRTPKMGIDQFIASKIINKRAEYALSLDKDVIFSKENDWTILINNELKLEDPIQSRTIFLKQINSVMDCIDLITPRIQTIGTAIYDREKLLSFSDAATYNGVARCVIPGQMNFYDSPWDGILFISRLVRWVTLYTPPEEKLR